MESYTFLSNSPAATSAFGKRLGGILPAGSVIAITGELGCGKTLLTQGICAGLDVPPRQVNSPTFVLVNEYRGRLPVLHMDLYRLGGEEEGIEIGLLDYLGRAKDGVMLVEWAEKIADLLPEDRLDVRFDILAARKREIEVFAKGRRFAELLGELKKK